MENLTQFTTHDLNSEYKRKSTYTFINQPYIELGPSLCTVPFQLIQFHTLLLNMHEPSRVRQVQNMKLLHYEACWTSSITFKVLGKLFFKCVTSSKTFFQMRFLSNAENNLRIEQNMNIQYLFDDIYFLFCKNLICDMTLEKTQEKKNISSNFSNDVNKNLFIAKNNLLQRIQH